jgi:hypothetical protein
MSWPQFVAHDRERAAAAVSAARQAISELLTAEPGHWEPRDLINEVRSRTGLPLDAIREAYTAMLRDKTLVPGADQATVVLASGNQVDLPASKPGVADNATPARP